MKQEKEKREQEREAAISCPDRREAGPGGRIRSLYTGSYNAPVLTGDGSTYRGNGRGILRFDFDEDTGWLEERAAYEKVENASWLAFSADGKRLYAVNELDHYGSVPGGALSSFAIEDDGGLSWLNTLPVMGEAPCHVSCDGSGRHVYTANYNGGNASGFLIREDGGLDHMDGQIVSVPDKERRAGSDPIRQEKPHVHSSAVCAQRLWITDLGTDKICVYRLDDKGGFAERDKEGRPREEAVLRLPAGSGPRSLAFGKEAEGVQTVYASCELSSQIAVLRWEENKESGERKAGLSLIGLVSTLPREKGGQISTMEDIYPPKKNLAGGILLSPDGSYLYVGNRGADNIGIFAVKEGALPEGVGWEPSGGANPRGFQISPSGKWLLAANQDGDNLVVFQRDASTGLLERKREYAAGAVVCLQFR